MGQDEQLSRLQRRALRALGIAQFAVVLFLVVQSVPGIMEERWVQDDAYISFRYARNLVEGNGLVYNAGERVEGYTNFLWTMLSAVPQAAGVEDPLQAMQGLGVGLWLATYALLLFFGLAAWDRAFLVAPLAVIPLLAHWSFNQWFVGGMETGLVSFLSLATLLIFSYQDLQRPAPAVLLSGVAVALLLARPDTVFFLTGVALAGLLCEWRWAGKRIFWRRWAPALLAPIFLVYIPYTVWRLFYYGEFLPNTYYAKMAYLPFYERGLAYLRTYFEIYDFLPMVVIPVVAALVCKEPRVRRFLTAAILGSSGVFLYVWRLGGDFMEWRFLMPVTGVLFTAIGVGAFVVGHRAVEWFIGQVITQQKPTRHIMVMICLVAGVLSSGVAVFVLHQKTVAGEKLAQNRVIPGQETIASLKKYVDFNYAWQEVGLACNAVLPAEAKIATTAAGMIPFFARRTTLDLHGLTNREIAHQPLGPDEKPKRLGHERKLEDLSLMRSLGVDVVVPAGYPLNKVPHTWSLTGNSDVQAVAVSLPGDRFFEIIILDPDSTVSHHLNQCDRVISADDINLVMKDRLVAHRDLLESHRLVDRLDLQFESSEAEHRFYEVPDPETGAESQHHNKALAYLVPKTPLTKRNQGERAEFHPVIWENKRASAGTEATVFLGDEGRALTDEAHWWISGVSSDRDLTMIVRHDRCAFSQYRVFVNGQRLPNALSLLRSRESWGEVSVVIPREFLLDGANDIGLIRDRGRREVAGLYYLWFLQQLDANKSE